MIYLTAHRVVSSTGESGINAFLHGCEDDGGLAHGDVQAVARAADNPGKLIERAPDLAPGGNRVRSHLDLVMADTLSPERLTELLGENRAELTSALVATKVVSGVGMRFGAEFGLYDALSQEYDALAVRTVALLENAIRSGTL